MTTFTAAYRLSTIIPGTAFFLAVPALIFSPWGEGGTRFVMRTESGLTVLGILVLISVLPLIAISMFMIFRVLVSLPALEYDGTRLRTYVYPFRSFVLGDIDRVELGSPYSKLHLRSGRSWSIPNQAVKNPDRFFEQLNLAIEHNKANQAHN